ncbi:hypothetical protein COB64_03270 [Candidatus Wolfebacteria bacterium]|nr:MAG: hypothetical protein COB64_03270 [Candidatus Wolfebacteria bacterium]
MKSMNSQSGQSLIEAVIAISIFVIGTVTIGFLVIDANVSTRQGSERTQAILLSKEGLEAARSIRDNDFTNLTTGMHGIALSSNRWIFSGTSDIQDQFMRQLTISDVESDIKKIKSVVSWQFSESRESSVTLVQYFTDWQKDK